MILIAWTPGKVELLTPPAGSKPGDLVLVEGCTRNHHLPLISKEKIFQACGPYLWINSDKEACYKVGPKTVSSVGFGNQELISCNYKNVI